jgi:hypothetical protein
VRFLCALVVAGCGRVGFTPTTGDGAVSAATVCGASTSAPASVTLSGSVFTYTSFQNTTAPIANATITAFDADSGAQLGTATSDGSGNYTINNVPPGSYTVTAWQEDYGKQTQKVTVAAGGAGTANFTYKAK